MIWDFQGTPVPPALVDDVCAFVERLQDGTELRAELAELLSDTMSSAAFKTAPP